MTATREQIMRQLIQYAEMAEDWDLLEIAEWTFGYEDPLIEKFREILEKGKNNESQGTNTEAPIVQS